MTLSCSKSDSSHRRKVRNSLIICSGPLASELLFILFASSSFLSHKLSLNFAHHMTTFQTLFSWLQLSQACTQASPLKLIAQLADRYASFNNPKKLGWLIKFAGYYLLLLDLFIFSLLVSATLLPLACFSVALTLATCVIHYFRPGIRPKHSAPCMASLAAMQAIFGPHPPNNPNRAYLLKQLSA